MGTLLFKTEPGDYSYDDLERDGQTLWTGVSNPVACSNLRSAKPGDDVLVYHTGDEKAVVGLARVSSNPAPDPKRPGPNSRGEIAFPVVTIKPVHAAKTPVTLAAIKADSRFKDFALVRQSRLSVMPVPPALDKVLRAMAGL